MTNGEILTYGIPEVAYSQRFADLRAMAASIVMRLYDYQKFKSEGYGNHDYVFHLIDKAKEEKGYEVDPPEAVQHLEAQGMRPRKDHPDVKRIQAQRLFSENQEYQGVIQ